MEKLWTLDLYRDDSETTVTYENVKHAFLTSGNTVLAIAQYADDGSHHYINWPVSRIRWWRLTRAVWQPA